MVLSSASDQILDIEFHRHGQLGLFFPHGIVPLTIATIQNGLALEASGLQTGMLLMGIQGESTAKLTYMQTLDRIREVGRPLRLTFVRPDLAMQLISDSRKRERPEQKNVVLTNDDKKQRRCTAP